jgi:2-haloacid dehalogenase
MSSAAPEPPERHLRALVFDAYGTLFDVHSVASACESRWPGQGATLVQHWRSKQLEYTWLRSLMNRYADFEQVTREALRQVCQSLRLALDPRTEDLLIDAWRSLSPFPEVAGSLKALERWPKAILSNGSPGMLEPLVERAGLRGALGPILSVDAVGLYKPAPAAYALATRALDLSPGQIGFISSNAWDACGAKAFGFHVFWVNRSGAAGEQLGLTADRILPDLGGLCALLESKPGT